MRGVLTVAGGKLGMRRRRRVEVREGMGKELQALENRERGNIM